MKSKKNNKPLMYSVAIMATLLFGVILKYQLVYEKGPKNLAYDYLFQAQILQAGSTLFKVDNSVYPKNTTELLVEQEYLRKLPELPVDPGAVMMDWHIFETENKNLYAGARLVLSDQPSLGITPETCHQIIEIASEDGYGCQTIKSNVVFDGVITKNDYSEHDEAVVYVKLSANR